MKIVKYLCILGFLLGCEPSRVKIQEMNYMKDSDMGLCYSYGWFVVGDIAEIFIMNVPCTPEVERKISLTCENEKSPKGE